MSSEPGGLKAVQSLTFQEGLWLSYAILQKTRTHAYLFFLSFFLFFSEMVKAETIISSQ